MKSANKKKDAKVMMVRVMCIFLCILMGGGSLATLLYYIFGGY